MRTMRLLVGLVLVGGTVVGCGTSTPAPATSTREFCAAYGADAAIPADGTGAHVRAYAAELHAVGAPAGGSTAVRQGFRVFVDFLSSVDERVRLDQLEPRVTERETAQVAAFLGYASELCSHVGP